MDLTLINNVWRPVFGQLQQGLRLLTPEWAQLEGLKNFQQLSPRAVNWVVDLATGGGTAATVDGGSLARALSNQPVEATDSWSHFTRRFEIGFDELVDEGDSKFVEQEIQKQVRYQARDALKSYRRLVAMMFYGHNTGDLFHVASVSNQDITIDDFYGESGLAVPERIRDYITPGLDYVAVVDASTDAEHARGQVTAIDETAHTITIESGVDLSNAADGDRIVLANQVITSEGSDADRWMNGLLDLTRATSLHNISSNDEPDWVAGVDESSHGDLRGSDLYTFFKDIEQRSMHPVEWAFTTTGVIADAGGSELDQRRYGAESDTMRLGFDELITQGVTVSARPFVPSGFMFIGSNSALRKLSPDEGSPEPQDVVDQGDKADGFQQYTDRLGFYKDSVFRAQLTAVSRLGLGVVSGITEA